VDFVEEVIEVSKESFESELGKDLIKYNDEIIILLQKTDLKRLLKITWVKFSN
jgi:hypothetical protein